MKVRLFLVTLAACTVTSGVSADEFRVVVKSGEAKRVHRYMHWKNADCSPLPGVVKLVRKPEHGKLTTTAETTTITNDRFKKPGSGKCMGRPLETFVVTYQSARGFRGSDSFQIEATYSKRTAFDVYRVTVE